MTTTFSTSEMPAMAYRPGTWRSAATKAARPVTTSDWKEYSRTWERDSGARSMANSLSSTSTASAWATAA